ncbi:hypothetical protein Tco_0921415 [Tanacetum coccineum]
MNGVGGDHGYNENGVIQVSDFEYEQGGGLPAASIEPVFEGSVSTVEDRHVFSCLIAVLMVQGCAASALQDVVS